MKVELWVVEIKKQNKEHFFSQHYTPSSWSFGPFRSPNANNFLHKNTESGCGAHHGRTQSATWDRRAVAGDSVASSKEQEEGKGRGELVTSGWLAAAEPGQLLDPAYPSGEKGVDGWRRAGGVRRWQGAGFDPPGSHVGQELVGYLGQHFLGQAGHAENVVTASVNVVAERDELEKIGEQNIRLDFGNPLYKDATKLHIF